MSPVFLIPFGDASVVGSPFACSSLALVVFFVAHFLRFLSTPRAFKIIAGADIEGRKCVQVENTHKMSVFS